MQAFYDASLIASILVQEVMKELKIHTPISQCAKNGSDKKIFKKCKNIIEKEYSDQDFQELLKLYVSSFFVEDSVEYNGVVYEDLDEDSMITGFSDFAQTEDTIYN